MAHFTSFNGNLGLGYAISGNAITEVNTPEYRRFPINVATQGLNNYDFGSGMTNTAQILFNNNPLNPWGSILSMGIYDSLSAGNLLMYFQVSPPLDMSKGGILVFHANTLAFNISASAAITVGTVIGTVNNIRTGAVMQLYCGNTALIGYSP